MKHDIQKVRIFAILIGLSVLCTTIIFIIYCILKINCDLIIEQTNYDLNMFHIFLK